MNNQVVVLDMGGQDTELIAREIRGLKVYCQVLSGDSGAEQIKRAVNPAGPRAPGALIITSAAGQGGYPDVPAPDDAVFGMGCPVLVLEFQPDREMLGRFLFETAGLKADWTPAKFATDAVTRIRSSVGQAGAISGVSGGVDSTVATILVHRAIGERLHCVLVDNGLLRKDEASGVVTSFSQLGIKVNLVDARERFMEKLRGAEDPEEKRKIIGQEFIKVFEEEARRLGDVEYMVQGTIYSDVLESGSRFRPPVKSHHNVGGLPERMDLRLLEPVRELFKDEVRSVGRHLGLTPGFIDRHPFPGPGLGIRVLGEVTPEKLKTVRDAQAILDEVMQNSGIYGGLWQCFCVLPGVRSVGVKEGKRTYGHLIAIRAVTSEDAMTADWARIPFEVLEKVSARITKEVPEVNRVVLDITGKPPSTIEWE